MPRRRRLTRFGLLFAITGLVTLIAFYVIGMAWWQSNRYLRYGFGDLLMPRVADVVIVMWLLWIGSAIGSFLNVVAWRMPKGMSLNGRSRCPRCESVLKARDNFPVFGWLSLGGRCRTCRLPISRRYPIVEAVVGLSITAAGVAELYRFALPYQTNYWRGGPIWAPIIDREMLIILTYHIVVLSTSWACALIRFDGQRLPRNLVLFGLATAAIPMLLCPPVSVVPWQTKTPLDWAPTLSISADGLLDSMLRTLCSLVAAVFFARLILLRWLPAADLKTDPLGSQTAGLVDLIVIIGLPVIVIGWQSTALMLLIAMLVTACVRPIFPNLSLDQSFALAMPVAMTTQIVTWRFAHSTDFLASVDCAPVVTLVTASLVWLGSMLIAVPSARPNGPPPAEMPS